MPAPSLAMMSWASSALLPSVLISLSGFSIAFSVFSIECVLCRISSLPPCTISSLPPPLSPLSPPLSDSLPHSLSLVFHSLSFALALTLALALALAISLPRALSPLCARKPKPQLGFRGNPIMALRGLFFFFPQPVLRGLSSLSACNKSNSTLNCDTLCYQTKPMPQNTH